MKVATVPEFLAKQLLKEFGFPWHVAPGEAEAECALLQQNGVVDAVISEDVDTLMFGSGVTLRNWNANVEGAGKGNHSPTHVSVYRAAETKERSKGIDREGMILVALMSGGDYIPEGVPGVGAKVACDAARAGFGAELCKLGRKDKDGLKAWKQRLEHEIRTNESKFFTRKNTGFVMPEDFPSREVLGYYTHPCVSTLEKVERLRREVKWDQSIDFAALRSFTADAFDWRCRGGAKKFVKNLAPALLIRDLRLRGEASSPADSDPEAQEAVERSLVHAIHGKRNHVSADGELEYRISFTPANLVPIDLSLEEEDDECTPAGELDDESDAESVAASEAPSSTQAGPEDADPMASPSKKRQFRPYFPDQPEKLWILREPLRLGCPMIVEDYEASIQDPKEFLKQRRLARANEKKGRNIPAPKQSRKKKVWEMEAMPENSLMAYARITKAGAVNAGSISDDKHDGTKRTMKELSPRANARSKAAPAKSRATVNTKDDEFATVAAFKLPSTQIPTSLLQENTTSNFSSKDVEALDLSMSGLAAKPSEFPPGIDPLRPFAAFASTRPSSSKPPLSQTATEKRTPKKTSRKRPPAELSSPAMSQKSILSYYSPSPHRSNRHLPLTTQSSRVINLVSSSPAPLPDLEEDVQRPLTPTPHAKTGASRRSASPTPRPRNASTDFDARLPETVTKRRRKEPLKRSHTEPVGLGTAHEDDDNTVLLFEAQGTAPEVLTQPETTILVSSSPARSDDDLASPSTFNFGRSQTMADIRVNESNDRDDFAGEGGFIRNDDDEHDVPNRSEELPPYPTPLPTAQSKASDAQTIQSHKSRSTKPPTFQHPKAIKKTKIALRESLEGAWKEVQVDASVSMLDMTGDGSGWKKSGGRAEIWSKRSWRKSGVEVLDLTGA